MGRLNRGPNGPFSGKAGSVIGSSWRNIFYIKGLQKKSNKARSPLQIEQQDRFGIAVKFLMPVKNVLNMGFSNVNPGGATGYNMAISHLLQNSIKGNYPDFEIDYPAVVFARGKLALPEKVRMELNGLNLKLNWSIDKDNERSYLDDTVEILIYSPMLKDYQISTAGITRKQEGTELELDPWYKGDTVHVYMYLIDRHRKKWSDSLYVGAVKVE
jgi:hypothetical protein